MINRRVVRTILDTTETMAKTNSPSSDALAFQFLTTQSFYVGFYGKFANRYFLMGVANTNPADITVEYWDGSAWATVLDVIDQTNGFTQSGFIHWENVGDWQPLELTPADDVALYWVRLKTSANLSATTTLQAVLNLYCDDELLRAYYPELISDSRYLPPGRTNFLEQYLAAKDLVVLRLRQRRLIQDESQIIDSNDVAVAAVHAAAKIIMKPIATSDEMRQRLADSEAEFDNEISQLSLNVDKDKSGVVSEVERSDMGEPFLRRR